MGSMEQTIAFLFRKKGGRPLKRTEMEFILAMDLRWFNMAQAKGVVEKAVDNLFIEEKDGRYSPLFQWRDVEIPSLFRPVFEDLVRTERNPASGEIERILAEPPAPSLFNRILDHIMKESKQEKIDIIRQMNEYKGLDVIPEMRLLMVARKLDLNVSGFVDETGERIREYSEG